MAQPQKANLLKLPDELLLNIMGELDIIARDKLTACNKRLRNLQFDRASRHAILLRTEYRQLDIFDKGKVLPCYTCLKLFNTTKMRLEGRYWAVGFALGHLEGKFRMCNFCNRKDDKEALIKAFRARLEAKKAESSA
jgi:hypothetical protein